MATKFFDEIETNKGMFMVLTKIRYLVFFKMPRSSVMPFKVADFVAVRFQIQYTTSDPKVLWEWHEMIVGLLRQGRFQEMAEGTHVGWFPYPDHKEHLQQFVKRFI